MIYCNSSLYAQNRRGGVGVKKRVKNAIVILIILAVVLGIGYFFFHNWLMRQPRFRNDLYENFRTRMDREYGSDEESANVRMESGNYIIVMLGRARNGDEVYYEVYQNDWRSPGQDLWNGPTERGTIHKGDDVKQISQEVRGQPNQWIYLFFSEDAVEVNTVDGGESRTVQIKSDTPMAVITETPPEELEVIHKTES